jgi:hypothetical protein
MPDNPSSRRVIGPLVAALVLAVTVVPGVAHALVASVDEPASTEPGTSQPDTTAPDTTAPDTTAPPTTEPVVATPATDGDDDAIVAVIGLAGFVALIAVAGWWMIRRNDDDDAPHPRSPQLDDPLPGQDLL